MISISDQIQLIRSAPPQVVILGAGASRAAFSGGDREGRLLPVMDDLVEIVGLDGVLASNGIAGRTDNFEDIYSSLVESKTDQQVLDEIELKIWDYFSQLELPYQATLYDFLILALRKKDLIASFN